MRWETRKIVPGGKVQQAKGGKGLGRSRGGLLRLTSSAKGAEKTKEKRKVARSSTRSCRRGELLPGGALEKKKKEDKKLDRLKKIKKKLSRLSKENRWPSTVWWGEGRSAAQGKWGARDCKKACEN